MMFIRVYRSLTHAEDDVAPVYVALSMIQTIEACAPDWLRLETPNYQVYYARGPVAALPTNGVAFAMVPK